MLVLRLRVGTEQEPGLLSHPLTPGVGAVSLCGMDSDGVAFLRADVERFCGELVELPPAIRLRLLTEQQEVQ